ncbi:MAG TPA: lactate utilization protein B [Streptosporangiaceae bacterium]|jgi:L-lactate dehydrogenase complex protein LldF
MNARGPLGEWLAALRTADESPPTVPKFAVAARDALGDTQLRRNLRTATATMSRLRVTAAGELDDWAELRAAGQAIKDHTLLNLDTYLEELERSVTEAGGMVHWARDADDACAIVTGLVAATGQAEVVKVKSMVGQEIGLNDALEAAGIRPYETELAELIVQLGADRSTHSLLPAIHRSRAEIRELFLRELPDPPADLGDEPAQLAAAARGYLRDVFRTAKVAISGANFAVADTGTLVVLEAEGNGRMSVTLPETLITVIGIEKVVPTWSDLEVFLQLLPRSSVGERMTPYVSTWTGVAPGDGPRAFHLVLLDNGRTNALADEVGRAALRCIRCSACLDVCPVYERTGGAAYGPVHPGPIGAILTPQLRGPESPHDASLPYASTLCGACADVCPVRIDIPRILVHLRGKVIESRRRRPVPTPEMAMMRSVAWTLGDGGRYEAALRQTTRWARLVARGGRIQRLPGLFGKWTDARDLPAPPKESFRVRWQHRAGLPVRRGALGAPGGPRMGRLRRSSG